MSETGPHQEFKAETFERECLKENDTSNDGIDWFLYREKIPLPILLSYSKKIQEGNPIRRSGSLMITTVYRARFTDLWLICQSNGN
jgi:hypothetical protein